jgi:hypothetical protein
VKKVYFGSDANAANNRIANSWADVGAIGFMSLLTFVHAEVFLFAF